VEDSFSLSFSLVVERVINVMYSIVEVFLFFRKSRRRQEGREEWEGNYHPCRCQAAVLVEEEERVDSSLCDVTKRGRSEANLGAVNKPVCQKTDQLRAVQCGLLHGMRRFRGHLGSWQMRVDNVEKCNFLLR
jgi:hypothetical protein